MRSSSRIAGPDRIAIPALSPVGCRLPFHRLGANGNLLRTSEADGVRQSGGVSGTDTMESMLPMIRERLQRLRSVSPRTALRGSNGWLLYLGFLFIPSFGYDDGRWLLPTLISLPLFLLLYWLGQQHARGAGVLETLGMALVGLLLVPRNTFASTYLALACASLPLLLPGLVRPLLAAMALAAVHAAEVLWLGLPPFLIAINLLISSGACIGNYFAFESLRKNLELQRSHEEVRRLAASAERERISRDLHDLLGHTLSLIAVKLELADRLVERDAAVSRREMREAQTIARDALAQVRSAVTGMRATGLAAEMVSSRLLLESSQIQLHCRRTGADVPADIDAALAMILREAITNVHRHAQATAVQVDVYSEEDGLHLEIEDDGRGGIRNEGNGLRGIRERVNALRGTLEIASPRGDGTRLSIRIPLPAATPADAGIASAA